MLFGLLVYSILLTGADPIENALESFRRLDTYSVTLKATTDRTEIIRYHYKKPGFIRMEFEEPHKGAILVYDPLKKEVVLRPFGFLKSFKMRLDPESRIIKSSRGHTVDESDIGALLEAAQKLRGHGGMEIAGDEMLGQRRSIVVEVTGEGGYEVDGINRYRLWLGADDYLPLKAEAYDRDGGLEERVVMEDLTTGPEFPSGFFSLD
ncbi:MAG TPA: hypothetical protein DDW94_04310 [Deltaproteobacteria bacterium]|nr:MAG: hypothetical protein A2Z79_10470 [Deltaproteobacteria bacterium GWA2_55_82]OGQ62950.1 MAG: hypothetical protein A3I81_06500 [Deltaproteobacteria bacterium RIFCSPLOWO2_02_FULL_55_12]OIJ72912.1 MAG: hypothetical protein A2V21_300735 [Deltaproteobacteria bacterium GWC2_55_46]HBG46196.1 hypothetical protein [Deltaproteobacteria bacterium]HCY11694.1 hypothetical protein [Deltaproteobacteria bacterium]